MLEAVYTTLGEAVGNRIAIRLGDPGRWLTPLLLWQIEPRLGVPIAALTPVNRIHEVEAPLLVIAGELDEHATLEQSRGLFEAAPDPKELWVMQGASHRDFLRFAPREYERRLLGFFARTVRNRSPR